MDRIMPARRDKPAFDENIILKNNLGKRYSY
jgi:hypothetical protein